MKKILLLIIAIFCSVNLFAQNQMFVMGTNRAVDKTALQVTVTVKKETIKTGPYARYAQQYLGVNALLNDKTTYSIDAGKISVIESGVSKDSNVKADADIEFVDMGVNPFVSSAGDVQADITRIDVLSAKDMAMAAANTIFTIRKRRLDVITGENQDAYGAGLESAIEEMRRIEQQYIDLFMGKKSISYSQYTFGVIPNVGMSNYILCRFSPKKGILDILSEEGKQIALLLSPENSINLVEVSEYKSGKGEKKITIIPDWVTTTLIYDGIPVTTAMVEVMQYGKMIVSED